MVIKTVHSPIVTLVPTRKVIASKILQFHHSALLKKSF